MAAEWLLVLRGGASLPPGWRLVSSLPPRLAVVALDAAPADRTPGVDAILTRDGPVPPLDPPLSAGERLFVDAWRRSGRKSGPRPGDGQPWDTPGFEPPGGPQHRRGR